MENVMFGDNTTKLSTSSINLSTYLYEAMIENVQNDLKLFEAMMKADALEMKYRKEGLDEASLQQFHENANKSIWQVIKDSLGWLAKKIKRAGELFWKAMDKAFKKIEDSGLSLKARHAVKKPENLEVEVDWYDFKHPVDWRLPKEQPFTIMDAMNNYTNDEAQAVKHYFGIDGASTNDFMNVLIGANSLDEVKTKKKIKDIPEIAKDGGGKLLKEVRKNTFDIKKYSDKLASYLEKLSATSDSTASFSDDSSNSEQIAKISKMLSFYKTNILVYNRTAETVVGKEFASIQAALIRLVGKENKMNESAIDLIVESATSELENYIVEAEEIHHANPDEDKSNIVDTDAKKHSPSKFDQAKKVAGGLASTIGNKIVEGLKKIKSWFLKAISAIEARILGDSKFIEKYKDDLTKHTDKINSISFNYPVGITDRVVRYSEHMSLDDYNKAVNSVKAGKITFEQKTIGEVGGVQKIIGLIKEGKRNPRNAEIVKCIDDATARAEKISDKKSEEISKLKAYVAYCEYLCKLYAKYFTERYKACKSALIKAVGAVRGVKESTINIMIEAAMDEIDETITAAINSNDAQGIEDVNLSSTNVLDSDTSTDPYALVYDKTDCYSQGDGFGDENLAGIVDVDLGDTETSVARGNETKAATESFLDFLASDLF